MAVVTLPLRPDLNAYSFQTELEGITYGFRFRWNEREAGWYFDLYDGEGVLLRASNRVVIDFPLLVRARGGAYPPGQFFAVDTGTDGDPGLNDLGARVQALYYESNEFA